MELEASMVYIGSEFQASMGFIRRLHKTNKQVIRSRNLFSNI